MTSKQKILNSLSADLESKVSEAKVAIASSRESRDSDTKSSAGDKHETGRAMMQLELEKNEVQLGHLIQQQNEIARINLEKEYKKVEFGSLVITSEGNYFISIGIGKLVVDNNIYYFVSLASPIGIAIKDKIAGDSVQFQGRQITIKEIY